MGTRARGKTKRVGEEKGEGEEEEEEGMGKSSVIFLSSSDDEEANRDLSLEIVEKARKREAKWNRKRSEASTRGTAVGGGVVEAPSFIDLSSSEEVDPVSDRDGGGGAQDPPAPAPVVEGARKKKKAPPKKEERKSAVEEKVETVDSAAARKEETVGTTDYVVTEENGISDNIVLRKLLRGPRYFDPGSSRCDACFNCGEEGHTAADCMMGKRKKPCFVCGMFGHFSYKCTQGQDCFICKRRGHVAKDCPDKQQRSSQDSKICLRCGDLGHDMTSCINDYIPDDLKEIQCYVCKSFGHLCCVDFMGTGRRTISCYNCGQSGHSGAGCTKPRGETSINVRSPSLCFVCNEEGHFARECPKKSGRWLGEPSTPAAQRSSYKKSINHMGFRSLPHDLCKTNNKRKSMQYEDRKNTTVAGKSKVRGGWIVDDPGDLPMRNRRVNGWTSPKTPVRRSHKFSSPAAGSHKYYVY